MKHLTKGLGEITHQRYPVSRCLINKPDGLSQYLNRLEWDAEAAAAVCCCALTVSPPLLLSVSSLLQSPRQLHRLPGLRPRAGGHLLACLQRALGSGGGHGAFRPQQAALPVERRLIRIRPARVLLCNAFYRLQSHFSHWKRFTVCLYLD